MMHTSYRRFPHPALFLPIKHGSNGPDPAFADGVAALGCTWKMQNLFLDVRCQLQQVHDLGHASPADMAKACEVCLVGDFAGGPDNSLSFVPSGTRGHGDHQAFRD